VTHLDTRRLEVLLHCLVTAYGKGSPAGAASAGAIGLRPEDTPSVVSHILGLVADVIRVRGLMQEGAGAVPTISPSSSSSSAATPFPALPKDPDASPATLALEARRGFSDGGGGTTAARVVLVLARLGHLGKPSGSAASSSYFRPRTSAPPPLLHALLESTERLLSGGKLSTEAALCLLQAYLLAPQGAAPEGAAYSIAWHAARTFEHCATSLGPSSAAQVFEGRASEG
jgi:hypothetical protein